MNKKIVSALLSMSISFTSFTLAETVRFHVVPPESTTNDDELYITGALNDWALEGDQAIKLNKTPSGAFVADVDAGLKDLFFTVVKNKDWQHMPARKSGNTLCLFHEKVSGESPLVNITFPAWTSDKPSLERRNTEVGNIKHLKDFDMGELNRKGDISIYLPPGYKKDSHKSYPVLYMLDGQNLFNEETSHSDEWKVDESLEELNSKKKIPGVIVVAIPNGPRRWEEYNPWNFEGRDGIVAKGEGKKTMDFIINTLKPYIDKHYATSRKQEDTGIAGSSLGGLMALYAAMHHADTFGFVGAFSPALSIRNAEKKEVLEEALKSMKRIENVKIYIDMGFSEYDGFGPVENLEKMLLKRVVNKGFVKLVKDNVGRHCELDWAKRFPDAVQWLL